MADGGQPLALERILVGAIWLGQEFPTTGFPRLMNEGFTQGVWGNIVSDWYHPCTQGAVILIGLQKQGAWLRKLVIA